MQRRIRDWNEILFVVKILQTKFVNSLVASQRQKFHFPNMQNRKKNKAGLSISLTLPQIDRRLNQSEFQFLSEPMLK